MKGEGGGGEEEGEGRKREEERKREERIHPNKALFVEFLDTFCPLNAQNC